MEAIDQRGRPRKVRGEKSVRFCITLTPKAVAILDERGNGRSQEIERLIIASG